MTRHDIEQLRVEMLRCFKYEGPYTLSSGRQSKYYYDGKGATQDPPTAWLIGNVLIDVIMTSGAEAVGGLEIGAVPIADAVGMVAHVERGERLPTFIVRKEAKSHGTLSQVSQSNLPDGSAILIPGRKVVIVDDVITTGGSIQKAIDVVRALGCEITMVIALVERHESQGELTHQGFPILRLFHTDEEGRLYIDEDFVQRAEAASQAGVLSR